MYEYASDYFLVKVEKPDEKVVFNFSHDEDGQREAKYRNGEMVEAYKWLDFIRLVVFHEGEDGYRFVFEDNERTPYVMHREDAAVASLHHDQIGSLRVFADASGNVIKDVLYNPFGGVIEDSNPDLRIPIGFAGGLHDWDVGFVRFGWRDYDTFTGRWTAPDPISDKGGDPDWYGYCLDDPVNGVDPLGYFDSANVPWSFCLTVCTASAWMVLSQISLILEPEHEQGFYDDGTGDNVGLGKEGPMEKEDITKSQLEDKQYDDKRMRRAQKSTTKGEYNLCGIGRDKNNCQDYANRLRERDALLRRGDRMR